MSKAVLSYFSGRGRGEICRLAMLAAGVEWIDVNLEEKAEFEQLKADGKLLFGQLPLVEYDGLTMVQSPAIARYFARLGNLLGDNPKEEFKINALYEGTRDLCGFFVTYGFLGWENVLDKAKERCHTRYLPAFEKALADNGSNGFLVGSKLTLADVGLFECVLAIEEQLGASTLDNFLEIKKFSASMKSIEKFANYLNGPQRYGINDELYVSRAKQVLL